MTVIPHKANAPAPAPAIMINDCVDSLKPPELTAAATAGGESVDVGDELGDLDTDTDDDKLGTGVRDTGDFVAVTVTVRERDGDVVVDVPLPLPDGCEESLEASLFPLSELASKVDDASLPAIEPVSDSASRGNDARSRWFTFSCALVWRDGSVAA
jgi:hypothetical protein